LPAFLRDQSPADILPIEEIPPHFLWGRVNFNFVICPVTNIWGYVYNRAMTAIEQDVPIIPVREIDRLILEHMQFYPRWMDPRATILGAITDSQQAYANPPHTSAGTHTRTNSNRLGIARNSSLCVSASPPQGAVLQSQSDEQSSTSTPHNLLVFSTSIQSPFEATPSLLTRNRTGTGTGTGVPGSTSGLQQAVAVVIPASTQPPTQTLSAGILSGRRAWDRFAPSAATSGNDREGFLALETVDLPPIESFRTSNPVRISGVPHYTFKQPLSAREIAWTREPYVRDAYVVLNSRRDPRQLAIRAQLREGLAVTQAGQLPPAGQECVQCCEGGFLPFTQCVSGGHGEKCNNCLDRSNFCSFQLN
ncbi:hypothetical protein AJ80_10026, partial [Polytolypa hystricis UAMH7299]